MCSGLPVPGIAQVTAGFETIHFRKNCAQVVAPNSRAHSGTSLPRTRRNIPQQSRPQQPIPCREQGQSPHGHQHPTEDLKPAHESPAIPCSTPTTTDLMNPLSLSYANPSPPPTLRSLRSPECGLPAFWRTQLPHIFTVWDHYTARPWAEYTAHTPCFLP